MTILLRGDESAGLERDRLGAQTERRSSAGPV